LTYIALGPVLAMHLKRRIVEPPQEEDEAEAVAF